MSKRETRIFGKLVQVVQRIRREAEQVLADGPVDPSRFYILSLLARTGPLPQVEIAEHMGSTAANVSQLLRRLEADGYVERPARRRTRPVHLTARGAALVDELAPRHANFLAAQMRRLSTEELETFEALLDQLEP
ncbi:MAG: MarR family transcriptional regulator [Myxococcota bacterium]